MGNCQSCGQKYRDEDDVQIVFIEPPRHKKDHARFHYRNTQILCRACAEEKGDKSFSDWLDEQEALRLSREVQ